MAKMTRQGERAPRARLTEAAVISIRSDDRRHALIASDHGIAVSTVSGIKCGFSWQHVPLEIGRPEVAAVAEIVVETVDRDCLACGVGFSSWGFGNRLCEVHSGRGRQMEEWGVLP